jgi:hypothetical protein
MIRVSKELKVALGLGKFASIVFQHPIADKVTDEGSVMTKTEEMVSGFLVVHAEVNIWDNDQKALFQSALEPNYKRKEFIQIDQTLRNALGIPFLIGNTVKYIPVYVYPLKSTKIKEFNEYISRLLGRRFYFFRATKAAVPDLEKGIARIPQEYFPVLGTNPGSSLVIERPLKNPLDRDGKIIDFTLKSFKVKAFEASMTALEERRILEDKFPWRYFPVGRELYDLTGFTKFYRAFTEHDVQSDGLLEILEKSYEHAGQSVNIEPDIPKIFLDKHERMSGIGEDERYNAEMSPITAVLVRRELGDIFVKELNDFGIAFMVSFLLFVFTMIQYFITEVSLSVLVVGLASVFSMVVIFGIMIWKIRAQVA